MGWEEMNTRVYPCWCGKGTFTEVSEMDDWNRTRSTRTINCPECAKKEEEEKESLKKERERLNTLEKEIKNYFEDHYMREWLACFATAKNKKRSLEVIGRPRNED
ncbi:hypothetical protein RWE15_11435 [Virgibacillus halophilus]|uniref:Uncharacterized protein n=1 Tax=Tigheibacillus halophilus TaxID=361280 RepID=A0ABU5C6J2_9BACI|nr:hypothetical protein [Virgibacillus halophilus]